MQDLKPTRPQMVLAAIATITYVTGWQYVDEHTAHALGWWVITLLAALSALSLSNVRYLARRLARVVQLECEQLETLRGPDDGPQGHGLS